MCIRDSFPDNCCNISILEDTEVDTIIYTFTATDADGPLNNQISFFMLDHGDDKGRFTLKIKVKATFRGSVK